MRAAELFNDATVIAALDASASNQPSPRPEFV
jgi:hypothetical protein